jgi:hypothetical protein
VIRASQSATGPQHDGASWLTAFVTVQEAIGAAHPGDEIWVSHGTYVENIILPSGISMFGGFGGAEVTREQRDPAHNPSVLDGNQAGSVITVSAGTEPTTIDGFTIGNGTGSGIRCSTGPVTITGNQITGNSNIAGDNLRGGGISVSGPATIAHNTIVSNSATSGGGICTAVSAVIEDNVIASNVAAVKGGGIEVLSGTATIRRNKLNANSAGTGGGISTEGSYSAALGGIVIAENVITGNSARSGNGGGICVGGYYHSTGSTIVLGNTIVANSARAGGGVQADGAAVLTNTIVAFNTSRVCQGTFGSAQLTYCDVYGNDAYSFSGLTDPTGQTNNISADPGLSSIYDDVHLQPNSLCIDKGDDTADAGVSDFYGNPRIIGDHIDIGADESDGTAWTSTAKTWHVSPSGNDSNDGSSWSLAKLTIGAAVAAAAGGDEVWVAQGTYFEHLLIPAGMGLYGGFAGSEEQRGQRDWNTNVTVIDGSHPVNGTMALCVAAPNYGVTIDGFTIRNGYGGIAASPASIVIANNLISGNQVAYSGGAILAEYGAATVRNNTLVGNRASYGGAGGASFKNCDLTFTNNTVIGNNGPNGGVLISNPVSALVSGNLITANYGSQCGGIYVGSGSATLSNNSIVSNSGHGVVSAGTLNIVNSIIAFNTSGGVVTAYTGSTAVVNHCDVYANSAGNFSGLTDPTGQSGNISSDPLFQDRLRTDYHLQSGSPAIDAGDDFFVQSGALDLDGHARVIGAHVDLGAYEYGTPAPIQIALPDVFRALSLAAGITSATEGDLARLNLEKGAVSAARIDVADAVRLARIVAGLDSNP